MNGKTQPEQDEARPEEPQGSEQIPAVSGCNATGILIFEDVDRYYIDLRGIGIGRISCNRRQPRTLSDNPLTPHEELINILCEELKKYQIN